MAGDAGRFSLSILASSGRCDDLGKRLLRVSKATREKCTVGGGRTGSLTESGGGERTIRCAGKSGIVIGPVLNYQQECGSPGKDALRPKEKRDERRGSQSQERTLTTGGKDGDDTEVLLGGSEVERVCVVGGGGVGWPTAPQLRPSPCRLLFQGLGNRHQTTGTASTPGKLKFFKLPALAAEETLHLPLT